MPTDYAYVITQDISNKFIEIIFCVGCMVIFIFKVDVHANVWKGMTTLILYLSLIIVWIDNQEMFVLSNLIRYRDWNLTTQKLLMGTHPVK